MMNRSRVRGMTVLVMYLTFIAWVPSLLLVISGADNPADNFEQWEQAMNLALAELFCAAPLLAIGALLGVWNGVVAARDAWQQHRRGWLWALVLANVAMVLALIGVGPGSLSVGDAWGDEVADPVRLASHSLALVLPALVLVYLHSTSQVKKAPEERHLRDHRLVDAAHSPQSQRLDDRGDTN